MVAKCLTISEACRKSHYTIPLYRKEDHAPGDGDVVGGEHIDGDGERGLPPAQTELVYIKTKFILKETVS